MSQPTEYQVGTDAPTRCHRTDEDWLRTSTGEKRGYIDPRRLRELWFHTGTVCNLRRPDCFEHATPGDQRIEPLTFDDARPFVDEGVTLGVGKFSVTGGEPFMVRDTVRILDYAHDYHALSPDANGRR